MDPTKIKAVKNILDNNVKLLNQTRQLLMTQLNELDEVISIENMKNIGNKSSKKTLLISPTKAHRLMVDISNTQDAIKRFEHVISELNDLLNKLPYKGGRSSVKKSSKKRSQHRRR